MLSLHNSVSMHSEFISKRALFMICMSSHISKRQKLQDSLTGDVVLQSIVQKCSVLLQATSITSYPHTRIAPITIVSVNTCTVFWTFMSNTAQSNRSKHLSSHTCGVTHVQMEHSHTSIACMCESVLYNTSCFTPKAHCCSHYMTCSTTFVTI